MVGICNLKEGRNTLLMKVCSGEGELVMNVKQSYSFAII